MVSVNGNFENKRNYYFTKEIVKKEIVEEKVEKAVVEEKPKFTERGDELLKSSMYSVATKMFVQNVQLDNEVANELREMYAMAGISHRLPTAVEYERIAGTTKATIAQISPLETEKHIELLFSDTKVMDMLAEETSF